MKSGTRKAESGNKQLGMEPHPLVAKLERRFFKQVITPILDELSVMDQAELVALFRQIDASAGRDSIDAFFRTTALGIVHAAAGDKYGIELEPTQVVAE